MPDPLPLVERLRRLAKTLYAVVTPAEMVAIRVLLREAAAALEAQAEKKSAFVEGAQFELDRLLARVSAITCISDGGKRIRDLIRDYGIYRKGVWIEDTPAEEALGVAPRLPDGEPLTPSAPPPDPSSAVPEGTA